MKISLLLIIYSLHRINCIWHDNLKEYLANQAKIVNETLIRHARSQKSFYDVKFNYIDKRVIGNYSQGEIFTILNNSYALLDQDLYKISNNYTTVQNFLPKENIILLKSTQYKNLGLLAIATNSGVIHIFGYNNQTDTFFKIQNIFHFSVSDVVFFNNQNYLYMVVSNYRSDHLASINIYKFVESHFDETEKILIAGVTKLYTFSNNQSEIIMALRDFELPIVIYEFKNNQIQTIQKVDVNSPDNILSYLHEDKRYILIFNKTKINTYLWTGYELKIWKEFIINSSTKQKEIFYSNNKPYIITSNNDSLLIFALANNYELIYQTKFNDNITEIWTYYVLSDYSNTSKLIILGSDINNIAKINVVNITIKIQLSGEKIIEEQKLSNCFLSLEKTIYKFRNQIDIFDNDTKSTREANNEQPNQRLIEKYNDLLKKYDIIKDRIENMKENEKILVVNENSTIKGPIKANKANAKDLRFEQLNNKLWQPNQWLSYRQPQIISGLVKINSTKIDNLTASGNNSLFNDLLLVNGNQNITGHITVKNLKCDNLNTKTINNINMDDLYFKNKPVIIEGVKRFSKLIVKNLESDKINEMEKNQIVALLTNTSLVKYIFDSNIKIENLWVDYINGINFDKFKNSVFRLGTTDSINGNLTFTNIEVKNMTFETLSNKTSFFTTSTDQIINSSITISKIFAKNITAKTVNGIDFKNKIATLDDAVIKGPVNIKNLHIKNNLEMKGKIDVRYLRMKKTHIIGTNESDLLQRYNANVIIKGNLFLKNLDLGKSSKFLISGQEFDPKIDQFWTKTSQQVIPTRFETKSVSTPHLFTKFINGKSVEDYMLTHTDQKKSTKFYFEDVVVKGNVVLKQSEHHSPNLRQIQEEAVKINGTFKIKGHEYYNILKIDNLKIKRYNNTDIDNFIDNNKYLDITNKPKNLIIKGNLHFENLSTEVINDINLNQLLDNTLYLDKAANFDRINFKNASVKNLHVNTLNGQNIDELILKTEKIKSLDNIKNLYIDGNVKIQDIYNLSTINDLSVKHLLQEGMKKFYNNTVFGNIKFLGHVKVKDLYVTILNDVDLQKLSYRTLYKSWNQTISQPFKFKKLITENLITDKVNDVDISTLIDVSNKEPQNLFVPNGLRILEQINFQNLNLQLKCDLSEALKKLRNPQPQFWNNITVMGNTTFMDKDSIIRQIFEKVVTTNGNQIIKGKTTFVDDICVNNVTTLKKINNIDLMEIIDDAFINDPNLEQTVKGKKTFIHLKAEDIVTLQNTNVTKINEFNISEINKNIVNKNSISDAKIKGKKIFFGGLQAKKIEVNEISGIKPENLVSSTNATKIPIAIFDSLEVINNFNVKFVNNMPFDEFLNERLLKKSPKQTITGTYFFKDIKIKGNISTSQINTIKIENIVYDNDTQIIESLKRFNDDLVIVGNITVDFINGFKISELYEKAVMKKEDTNFNGSVTILSPTIINGNITTKYINNVPMEYMLETNSKQSLTEAKTIYEITQKISEFVIKYLNITIRTPTEYLYIEKSTDLQISVQNTLSAQIVETKDDILIHIESEEDGQFCGLPTICKCPFQQTMQISSEHSISSFINKATQRIYTYYDNDIIIHLISNSVSTSSFCRTNRTKVMNEISSLTWNTLPQINNTGAFFMHQTYFTGYISGVQFFTAFGKIYVIIAFYYDPVLDTHNLDCLVLRFSEDKTVVEEIQRIPTEAAKTVSLIHTAQGVILILANDEVEGVNASTNIFRFSKTKEQFELLRRVQSFGSLFAVGVVSEMDNLIILGNKYSLYILKYQEQFDNYYFYQNFQLNDIPISYVTVFYAKGFGISDAYLTVVTKNSKYFIYSFQYIEGWKLESTGELEGIKSLVPFKLNKKLYLFASSSKLSSLLTVVEHGLG